MDRLAPKGKSGGNKSSLMAITVLGEGLGESDWCQTNGAKDLRTVKKAVLASKFVWHLGQVWVWK